MSSMDVLLSAQVDLWWTLPALSTSLSFSLSLAATIVGGITSSISFRLDICASFMRNGNVLKDVLRARNRASPTFTNDDLRSR